MTNETLENSCDNYGGDCWVSPTPNTRVSVYSLWRNRIKEIYTKYQAYKKSAIINSGRSAQG